MCRVSAHGAGAAFCFSSNTRHPGGDERRAHGLVFRSGSHFRELPRFLSCKGFISLAVRREEAEPDWQDPQQVGWELGRG